MPEILEFTVPDSFHGKQAKFFLRGYCRLSARMITRLKREKDGILMNGKFLRTIDPVEAGALVTLKLPSEESEFVTPTEGLPDIVYEDGFLLAVNKPPFMPVHPVKQYQTDTLANHVAFYMKEKGERYVFRAHNRLDRNTSGLVLIAKDKYTVNCLKGNTQKRYTAIVHGEMSGSGTIKEPIGLLEDSKIRRHVLKNGSPAITHYEVLKAKNDISVLELWLETGKTHQIRCHLSHLGHPLLGDDLYGGKRDLIDRHALHCGEMSFIHPVTGKKIILKAKIPEDMERIIKAIYTDT